jgi:cytochrome b561
MLFFMAAATHFTSLTASLDMGEGQLALYWILAIVVIAVFEAGALMGPGLPTQKPLATVKGTIHAGVGVTVVLFALQFFLLR